MSDVPIDQPPSESSKAPRRPPGQLAKLIALLLVIGSGFASWFAWTLPLPKDDAVLGRLDFGQFVTAVVLSAVFAMAAVIGLSPRVKRRTVGFRIVAVGFSAVFVVVVWEAGAYLLPARHLDNPYYTTAQFGLKGSRDLPYERPPHLKWKGASEGDLALGREMRDPYARTVMFQTDFEGFRNSVDLRQADIIFVGDSFTEAGYIPEDETFAYLVAEKLKLTGRNLGRNGYTTQGELVVLRKYGVKCKPRYVIWQVAEANDLNDAVAFRNWYVLGRTEYQFAEQPSRIVAWKRRSPSYLLFNRCVYREPPLAGVFRDASGADYPIHFRSAPGLDQCPVGHNGWELMADAFRQGAELAKSNGIQLIVVYIPMKMRAIGRSVQFDDSTRQRLGDNWELPENETLAFYLEQLCRDLNVYFLDTTPQLQQSAAAGELVYLPFDTHISPKGHVIVSEMIVDLLRDQGRNDGAHID